MKQTANHCQNKGATQDLPFMKQYNPKHKSSAHTFYVLCKGLNSGKPLNAPAANSFEIQCKDAVHRSNLFWLCFSLWQTKAFESYIHGTAIPFLTLYDFKKVITHACNSVEFDQHRRTKLVSALEKINQLEEYTMNEIKLIKEYKLLMIKEMLR